MEDLNQSESTLSVLDNIEIQFESVLSKKIRGANFSKNAFIYIDKYNCNWLWKNLPFHKLVHEYIVSLLASIANISIPRILIANNGHSFGLIEEWLSDVSDLSYQSNNIINIKNSNQIYDILVFEAWIGAIDRHGGNYLLRNGEIWGIDYEECFYDSAQGSELCLYLPWIKDSKNDLKEAIIRLKKNIAENNLLDKKKWLNKLSDLIIIANMKDPRAVNAIKRQLQEILYLLTKNFAQLEKVVEEYIKSSYSLEESIFAF